jgi:hypothetical protein
MVRAIQRAGSDALEQRRCRSNARQHIAEVFTAIDSVVTRRSTIHDHATHRSLNGRSGRFGFGGRSRVARDHSRRRVRRQRGQPKHPGTSPHKAPEPQAAPPAAPTVIVLTTPASGTWARRQARYRNFELWRHAILTRRRAIPLTDGAASHEMRPRSVLPEAVSAPSVIIPTIAHALDVRETPGR